MTGHIQDHHSHKIRTPFIHLKQIAAQLQRGQKPPVQVNSGNHLPDPGQQGTDKICSGL